MPVNTPLAPQQAIEKLQTKYPIIKDGWSTMYQFQAEKDSLKQILSENGALKEKFIEILGLEYALTCSVTLTYFYKYLVNEFNAENLQAYLEIRSLTDFVKHSRESVITNICYNLSTDEQDKMYSELVLDMEQEEQAKLDEGENEEQSQTDKEKLLIDIHHLQMCVEKFKFFVEEYISDQSANEVNLPTKAKKECMNVYKTIESKIEEIKEKPFESEQERADTMIVFSNEILEAIETINKELLVNLSDPFSRYKNSDFFTEAFSVFMTKQDFHYHRAKILSSNKNGIVLNNNSKGWNDEIKVRHPVKLAHVILEDLMNSITHPFFYKRDYKLDYENIDPKNIMQGVAIMIDQNFEKNYNFERKPLIFEHIDQLAYELNHIDMSLLKTDEEKLAFFVNIYNIMMIHSIVKARSPPLAEMSKNIFMRKIKYNLGGLVFSLEDIRSGVLLGNESKSLVFGKQFSKKDKRLKYAPSKVYPNVIFALTDLSCSSPFVEPINFQSVHNQFHMLALKFFKKNIKIEDIEEGNNNNKKKKIAIPSLISENRFLFGGSNPKQKKQNTIDFVYNLYTKYVMNQNRDSFDASAQEEPVVYQEDTLVPTQTNKPEPSVEQKDSIEFEFSRTIEYQFDIKDIFDEKRMNKLKSEVNDMYQVMDSLKEMTAEDKKGKDKRMSQQSKSTKRQSTTAPPPLKKVSLEITAPQPENIDSSKTKSKKKFFQKIKSKSIFKKSNRVVDSEPRKEKCTIM